MLPASAAAIDRVVATDARLLDVGGWAKPFRRADAVLDLMPYSSRGMLGFEGDGPERFSAESWIERDICSREPWPFADKEFDFVTCSQTLEDIRDPIWVCSELMRVAKAGYIEVPSRLEEQSYGFQGPWVGWGHHHWLVEIDRDHIDFIFKHHVMHGRASDHFPAGFRDGLSDEERVEMLWWTGAFTARERLFDEPEDLDRFLSEFVAQELTRRDTNGDYRRQDAEGGLFDRARQAITKAARR